MVDVDERTCRNSKDPRRFAHALLVNRRLNVVFQTNSARDKRCCPIHSNPKDQCPVDLSRTEEDEEHADEDVELHDVVPLDECAQECESLGQDLHIARDANQINGSVDPCNCGGACNCKYFSESNEFYSQPDSGPSNEPEKCKPSTSDQDTVRSPFNLEWEQLFQQTFGDLILNEEFFNTPGNVEAAERIFAQQEEMTNEQFLNELEPFAPDPAVVQSVRRILEQDQVYGMSPLPPCTGATGNVLEDVVPNAETVKTDDTSPANIDDDSDDDDGLRGTGGDVDDVLDGDWGDDEDFNLPPALCGWWCRNRHRHCVNSVNLWKDNWSRDAKPSFFRGRNFLLEDSTGGGLMNIHWDDIGSIGALFVAALQAGFGPFRPV